MRYVGIDLAWGDKNTTAVVVLEAREANDPAGGATLLATAEALASDDDILAFVDAHDNGNGLLVAIDAPLIVPNVTGRRPCEAVLSACLAKVQAGPHPANRVRLATRNGTIRGERIAAALALRSLPQTPFLETLPAGQPPRAVFEVFPHPAHVALFGLTKTLKYKAKPGRTIETRLAEFAHYTDLLRGLVAADPPLALPPESSAWLARDLPLLALTALKRHEDALDALTCAYVALYHHRWGSSGTDGRSVVVGDLASGYIVTPADEAMRACFSARRAAS